MTPHEEIALIKQVTEIGTTVKDMHHRLFGNGQPGVVDDFESRISKLENWRWWVVGLCVGAGAFGGAGLMKLLESAAR